MFKVVADQLRISEGWVRCGHCQEVFDASAHLQPSQPPALMPDMALDKVRPPPQPVPRTAPPVRAWGTSASGSPPASAATGADAAPPIAETVPERAIAAGSAAKTLQFPDSTVPAFLAASPAPAPLVRQASSLVDAPLPPLAWEAPQDLPPPVLPAAQAPSMEWPAIEFTPGPLPVPPPMGYELPAPLLEDSEEVAVEPERSLAGSDSREAEAAPVLPDPPPDRALREALNEVLARRASPQPVPDLVPQEQGLGGPGHSAPAQAMPTAAPEFSAPEAAPSGLAPENTLAENDQGHSPAMPVEMESEADALAGELSFVRAARRKAFWRKTPVRLSLVVLVLVLLCGLVLQAAVHERRWIAAAWPALRPYLVQLCGPLECDVGPYRQIAAVTVDGSTFHKIKGDQYQFSLTLKSRSSIPLEMPAVELTLTDAQDQPVLRRVLTPQDLAAPVELAALGEWNLSVSLLVNLGSTRITGYRVLAFYP